MIFIYSINNHHLCRHLPRPPLPRLPRHQLPSKGSNQTGQAPAPPSAVRTRRLAEQSTRCWTRSTSKGWPPTCPMRTPRGSTGSTSPTRHGPRKRVSPRAGQSWTVPTPLRRGVGGARRNRTFLLNNAAKRAIRFWRAMLCMGQINEEQHARPISSFSRDQGPVHEDWTP